MMRRAAANRWELVYQMAKFAGAMLVFAGLAFAQSGNRDKNSRKDSKSQETPTTRLRIEVSGNAKPIGNASVYVRFDQAGGGLFHRGKKVEMNFKTNQDGSVKVPEIPQGKALIQVVAPGWHTYGRWYELNQSEETIQIKLEKPPHWY